MAYHGRKGIRYGQGRDIIHDWQRKAEFGLTSKDKWPDEGLPERMINGLLHKVFPKGEGLGNGKRTRRAVAQCPQCQRWICAGHFGQHRQGHKD